MHDLTLAPGTDPTLLYRGRDELYAEDMLIAAVKGFDFFTVLAGLESRVGSIDEIARHFGFQARPVDVMTTQFVARGLLQRRLMAKAQDKRLGGAFDPFSDVPLSVEPIENPHFDATALGSSS